jgi:hypothetical protein
MEVTIRRSTINLIILGDFRCCKSTEPFYNVLLIIKCIFVAFGEVLFRFSYLLVKPAENCKIVAEN